MKKVFLSLLGAFMISANLWAWDPISFTVSIDDDNSPVGNGFPKSPIQSPTVYIENHMLSFAVGHPEYVLYIKDENDVVVYSTVVTSTETLVTLPSTLSGEYKIELVMDNWLFTGYIML